ncbi:hypothetical protein HD806DRAFT_520722 [Xylariaceae sp. AK1471]|nr:hypothetical protein HD806DRAFT_520722 [Xylariaceae sp. AK1471]
MQPFILISVNKHWLAQIYAIIQESLTLLERIVEYISIDQEETYEAESTRDHLELEDIGHQVLLDWPKGDGIRFYYLTALYAPHLELSFRQISFQARAGERVAVIGRTVRIRALS